MNKVAIPVTKFILTHSLMKKILLVSCILGLFTGQAAHAATSYQLKFAAKGLQAPVQAPQAPAEPEPPAPPPPAGALTMSGTTFNMTAFPTLTSTSTVVATNTGNADLTITARNFTGPYGAKFSASGCAVGTVLAPAATCTVTTTFTPGSGAALENQQGFLEITHTGNNDAQQVAYIGSSSYTAAYLGGASGSTPPTLSGNTATWTSAASWGGFGVGTTYRNTGKYIISFSGTPASLDSLEYNIQNPTGGYYGISFPSSIVVKGGSISGGAVHGTPFTKPTLNSGNTLAMTMDWAAKTVTWYRCTSAGTCTSLHSVSNLSTENLKVYSWKPGAGAVTVTVVTQNSTMSSAPTGFHNGMPH